MDTGVDGYRHSAEAILALPNVAAYPSRVSVPIDRNVRGN